jgi:hypothetical protein
MQDIVESSISETRKAGGKRISPYHLCVVFGLFSHRKRAVQTNETFDFLKDIVERVPDPLEGGGAPRSGKRRKVAKEETEGDAEGEADE